MGPVNKLKTYGWEEDSSGSTAYYVIKNAEGKIVMFFSLKCGALFDPGHVQKFMEEFDETRTIYANWRRSQIGDEAAVAYMQELHKLLGNEEYRRRINTLEVDHYRKVDLYKDLKSDNCSLSH